MACKIIIISILVILTISTCDALRFLVFFPSYSRSHAILGQAMVTKLLDAGHEVVHITTFPRDKPVANLTEVNLVTPVEWLKIQADENKLDIFKLQNLVGKENFGNSYTFIHFNFLLQKISLKDPDLIKLLKDPKQEFDAVILEWHFADMIAGIAPLFRSPLIWFGSLEADWQTLRLVDEIPNPSYNVDVFSSHRPPLSFGERVNELYTLIKKLAIYGAVITPHEKAVYNDLFPKIAAVRGVSMPSYEEAVKNGSFLLLNSHPSIGTPSKLPQNAKYIAGYHIDAVVQPLPEDLQKLMDGAKDGVIYFSMGSSLKSIDMTDYMRNSLLDMFTKLKQTVIWKYEGDLDKVPKNVHLFKFVPQQSILAHPNLKFFITHGGQLSTTEAVHFAVPVIGIPVLCDQYVNMLAITNKGLGIMIHLAENMAFDISVAIEEMLGNSSYQSKAKEISTIYHNRQQLPGEELVYWIEYVVRTKGAPHLKSLAITLPFYKKMYIDLISIILLVFISIVLIIRKLMFRTAASNNKTKGKRRKEKRHRL